MLKTLFLLISLTITLSLCEDDKYTTKYDNIDVDEILNSERLLNNYIKCMLDQGPCTPDGAELKRILRDALETDCARCNQKQKDMSMKVAQFLSANKPAIWSQLEARYDPDGVYKAKYADRLTTPKP